MRRNGLSGSVFEMSIHKKLSHGREESRRNRHCSHYLEWHRNAKGCYVQSTWDHTSEREEGREEGREPRAWERKRPSQVLQTAGAVEQLLPCCAARAASSLLGHPLRRVGATLQLQRLPHQPISASLTFASLVRDLKASIFDLLTTLLRMRSCRLCCSYKGRLA